MKTTRLIALCISVLLLNSLYSQTTVPGGYVTGNWTQAGSPYVVFGDIEVSNSQTLIIEPGVDVIFANHSSFTIHGRLLAEGTINDSITFSANNAETGWKNLYLYYTSTSDSTIISYCRFEYINNQQYDTGYINIKGSSNVRISNCLITNNRSYYYGLLIYECDPLVKDLVIINNEAKKGGGLSLVWADPYIYGTNIINNQADQGGGIYMAYAQHPFLSGTRIIENKATLGGGIFLDDTYPSSGPYFSSTDLCSVYLNYAVDGTDVYSDRYQQVHIDMYLDTATVLFPEKYYFGGVGRDDIDTYINAGLLDPVNADLYVSPAGSDENDGLSPANPLKTIARAVLTIVPDSSGSNTIHLAAGTYSESANDQVFQIYCREDLFMTGAGTGFTFLDGENMNRIFYSAEIDNVHISDLSIINAYHSHTGGGFRCSSNTAIHLDSIRFENCFAANGGALMAYQSQIYLSGCDFISNTAANYGGALSVEWSDAWMNGCRIENNGIGSMDTVNQGGGLYCESSHCEIVGSEIKNNTANYGGGIYVNKGFGLGSLNGSGLILEQNNAVFYGGAIFIKDDDFNHPVHIDESAISGNTASGGGAFCVGHEGFMSIYNSEIFSNVADTGGGGFVYNDATCEIYYSKIYNNTALEGGGLNLKEGSGAVYHTKLKLNKTAIFNNAAQSGGAVYTGNAVRSYYYNVTMYGNNASDGGGISWNWPYEARVHFYNSIIRANTPNQFNHSDSIRADYCDIQGAFSGIGSNNFDADPLFENPAGGNFHLTWDNYPVEDATKSPCIDAGDPSETDPDGSILDVGAFYYHKGTHVCGVVSGTWTADKSPYVIECNTVIPPDSTLIIEPGVEVLVKDDVSFYTLRGRIIAEGTVSDTIVFHPLDTALGWTGLRFYEIDSTAVGASSLKYCKFEYGKNGDDITPGKGAGIYCDYSGNLTIEHCLIANNNAVLGYGGGIWLFYSDVYIMSTIISDNTAFSGGGIFSSYSNPLTNDLRVCRNTATIGGGATCSYSNASFIGTRFYDNTAVHGGAFSFDNGQPNIGQTLINNNQAEKGGAVFFGPEVNADIYMSTIVNNFATLNGAAISCYDGTSGGDLYEVILWENQGPDQVFVGDGGTITADFSDIQLPVSDSVWPGDGNINKDPLFVDPQNNDYHLSWQGYPLPDEGKSPCIDTGNPASTDPDGTRQDMGFYVYYQVYTPLPGGSISGELSCADSPYYVYGNLQVPAGEQLTIQQCVTLMFQGDYYLEVRGRLVASGSTGSDRITFAAADTIEGWQGIRFINTTSNGQDSSLLQHCRVTFGNANGWSTDEQRGGALFIKSSGDVLIRNCLLNKNRAELNGGAVYSSGASGPLFLGNVF